MGLPRDETAFFGRTEERATTADRLAAARLVTLVGLGGMGKSRLAVHVAESLAPRFPGGVGYVALSAAPSIEAVLAELARAVGKRVSPEAKTKASVEAVTKLLAARGPMLLVVDGADAVAGDVRPMANLVSALLDGARELRILATSRQVVGVRGEEKLVVEPLDDASATALLLDRARIATGGSSAVTEEQARAIAAKVDRIPLAIELAASRLEVLAPDALLARLATKLDVLAAGKATMRATLDASWELLDEVERDLLAQASVFVGPFEIDLAEDVLVVGASARDAASPDEGGATPEIEVLDVLERLVRKSFLTRGTRGPDNVHAVLGMLETVRTWAREKLERSGNAAACRLRHAEAHLASAEAWSAKTYGESGVRALDALEALLPDLTAAFATFAPAHPAEAARVVLALSDLLLFRSVVELRASFVARGTEAAERAGDPRLLARTLVANGRVILEDGRMADAEATLLRARDLANVVGDVVTAAEATRSLGWTYLATGRKGEARAALGAALAMHREQGSARGLADANVALGIGRALEGDAEAALGHLREALTIHVEHGDVVRQEKVLGFGALVGQDARTLARGLPREVLAHAPASAVTPLVDVAALLTTFPPQLAERDAGADASMRWQSALALYQRGAAAESAGDAAGAIAAFDKALTVLARAGVTRGLSAIRAHSAVALAASGDLDEARARLAMARAATEAEPAAALTVETFAAAADLVGVEPSRRSEATAVLARADRAEGVTPELVVARRVLARALRGEVASDATTKLVVGDGARWIVPPEGARIDLARYGPIAASSTVSSSTASRSRARPSAPRR